MEKLTAQQELHLIADRLRDAHGARLRGVVLYGSEARGDAGPDSDIDVLVLLDGPICYGRDLRTAIHATYPLVLEWDRVISPEPADVREYEAGKWPLYRAARAEGMVA